jgi:hypothetical protein
MQVWLNRDGSRNRAYRPYVDQEELHKNVTLYDPNGPGWSTGLYERTQPPCMRWEDHFYQFMKKNTTKNGSLPLPDAYEDTDGRYYLLPDWYSKDAQEARALNARDSVTLYLGTLR